MVKLGSLNNVNCEPEKNDQYLVLRIINWDIFLRDRYSVFNNDQ